MNEYRKEYLRWISDDVFDEKTKTELKSITDEKEIEDRFYKELSFGTGGLRGILGAGTNRMNLYTVGKASQGLADFINSQNKGGSVAIAFDSRNMSEQFAKRSAEIFAANGLKVYIFDSLRPTPELSFAVRTLRATAGVVITASHNPPEYNGYKVYYSDGGQIVPPFDKMIIDSVRAVRDYSDIKTVSFEEAKEKGLISIIGGEIDRAYLDRLKQNVLNAEVLKKQAPLLKIVYSPLNGTGKMPVLKILSELGFTQVYTVLEQSEPDGNFPTLKYPNPEDPAAFSYALELAKKVGADIVMATDPDADRLGIYAKDGNEKYVPFTGNMTGILIAEYQLSQKRAKGLLPVHSEDAAIVTTIVSTDMAAAVAKEYGVTCIEVLTGFKYIGEKIKLFESAKEKNGGKYCARCGAFDFIFGFEESYGCLLGTHARDKDAVAAVAALAEAAAFYAERGISLPEAADNLFRKYGYYKEALVSKVLKGADGAGKIRQITENLRNNPAKQIGSEKVVRVRDYLKNTVTDTDTGAVETTGLPQSDVMYFELEGGWCCIRPSGTEPKIKLYMGVVCETEQAAIKRLEILKDSLTEMLGL